MTTRWILIAVLALSTIADAAENEDAIRERAVAFLRHALSQGGRWVKVHAAESLVALDYRDGVRDKFAKESMAYGDEPGYRIGILRVLARTDRHDEEAYSEWIKSIRVAAVEVDGPDRAEALESLAILGYLPPELSSPEDGNQAERKILETFGRDLPEPALPFALWLVANSGSEMAEARLAELLSATDATTRWRAASALRKLSAISKTTLDTLIGLANPKDGFLGRESDRVYVLAAAWTHAVDQRPEESQFLKGDLLSFVREGTPEERKEACAALASKGRASDVELLGSVLDDANVDLDVKVTAATAICRIGRRKPVSLSLLDWFLITSYFTGMVLVGVFYSRRSKTTDDYLLGGRRMNPFTVGLSMFATLLSTISYLGAPGEMIRWGPMYAAQSALYPFVFFVVGWLIIPAIMKLRVTTAYEILQVRLGTSARVLGSTIFLTLRLLWMATIIYVTTSKVIVPLVGWDESVVPFVCVALGAITILYTSLGGLQAVVLTDSIQTVILFLGAILTIVLVTNELGGVGEWIPSSLPGHWKLEWWDLGIPRSFLGFALAAASWYIFTAGSDQVAIQRYLATRDAKSARRVLLVCLVVDFLVMSFLLLLGLALLAYFTQKPHAIPDNTTLLTDPDKLFPRFITYGLPVGISGIVIAGLLAAAMSSLSSGVNSSSSVITVDLIDRFRKKRMDEESHVRLAKWVSVAVGVIAVGGSLFIPLVQGNIMDIAYRVVNLLTAPLFLLFFFAIFIPWATEIGALIGSVVGIGVANLINFWELIFGTEGISFLFIMPGSFMAGALAGMLVSLIPPRRKEAGQDAPPLDR